MVELERVSDSLSVKGQPGRGKWVSFSVFGIFYPFPVFPFIESCIFFTTNPMSFVFLGPISHFWFSRMLTSNWSNTSERVVQEHRKGLI